MPKNNILIMKKLKCNYLIKDKLLSISKNVDKIKKIEKSKLIEYISKSISKNITFVKYIYLKQKYHFGNQLFLISRTIFYCEILGCKKIILEKNKFNWFIKNKIIYKKYKIIIEINNKNNLENLEIIVDSTTNIFYYKYYLKSEIRINLLRNEILSNLPKVLISNRDLYIYIRSGDIFINPHPKYRQPPLCFYVNVINNFEFRGIYIIAQNKNNPVIGKLLEKYSNIIYLINSIKVDIAHLVYAYNIVGGATSTFLKSIILLNKNLQFLWDFKLKKSEKNFFRKFNLDFYYSNKINQFIMYASDKYINEMKIWKNNKIQLDLMLNEKCNNNFIFI